MSNQQVGTVYQQIISDVVESSRVDFEEGGVDEHVLEELRLVEQVFKSCLQERKSKWCDRSVVGWQQKLSQLQVATFPWDPKPEPQPTPMANPPTVPSNAGFNMATPPQHQPQTGLTLPQMNNNQNQGPRIKPDPEDPQAAFQNPMINLPNATTAQQRAAQHLQNSYGPRAAASINAIQSTAGGQPGGPPNPQLQHQMQMQQQQQHQQMQMQQQQQQQRPVQGIPQQPQQAQRPQMTPEQYRAAMARQAAQQQAQIQSRNGSINGAQTDGAGDYEVEGLDVIKQFDASGNEVAMGRIEIDGLLRKKIEAMGHSMEGGGLMLPLQQASTASKRQRKVAKKNKGVLGGGDAIDDDDDKTNLDLKDDELDEDAINSDLDDPDDGLDNDEDDDDSMGHIMLCMYDKVQRVKNKWKCVMKDGVLTVNGREYVFHKASGEYEW